MTKDDLKLEYHKLLATRAEACRRAFNRSFAMLVIVLVFGLAIHLCNAEEVEKTESCEGDEFSKVREVEFPYTKIKIPNKVIAILLPLATALINSRMLFLSFAHTIYEAEQKRSLKELAGSQNTMFSTYQKDLLTRFSFWLIPKSLYGRAGVPTLFRCVSFLSARLFLVISLLAPIPATFYFLWKLYEIGILWCSIVISIASVAIIGFGLVVFYYEMKGTIDNPIESSEVNRANP